MQKFAALLRAVNVGGTGKLPMAELRAICVEIGFQNPKTLLASGNVVFETELSPDEACLTLNNRLAEFFGKEIGLFVLSPSEMRLIEEGNPFPDHPPNQIGVLFTDNVPTPEEYENAKGRKDEVMIPGKGVLYIKFPSGMGQSKLAVPGAKEGTMRNMNTVAKLSAMLNE